MSAIANAAFFEASRETAERNRERLIARVNSAFGPQQTEAREEAEAQIDYMLNALAHQMRGSD